MRVPATIQWIGLALLGLLIAAGVSIAASRLAGQQIGLSSQPMTAGDALAPPGDRRPSRARPPRGRESQPAEPVPTEAAPPSEATEPAPEAIEPVPTEAAQPPGGPPRSGGEGGGDSGHDGSRGGDD